MSTQISYWNLINSHWEPCKCITTFPNTRLMTLTTVIDPWTFTVTVSCIVRVFPSTYPLQASKEDVSSGITVGLSARERLDLNLSTTFADMAITTLNVWSKEGERVLQNARGSYAPYHIRNRTGSPIYVWSDDDGATGSQEALSIKVLNDDGVDWRFDDWKTLREVISWFNDLKQRALSHALLARIGVRSAQYRGPSRRSTMGKDSQHSC